MKSSVPKASRPTSARPSLTRSLNYNAHRTETFDDPTARNDLELLDLEADPDETTNLAEDPTQARDLILKMNTLLNRTLDEEVGTDDGSFLPTGTETPWEIDRWDI